MKAISLLSLREQDACCQLNIKLPGSWGWCVRGQKQSGELAVVILSLFPKEVLGLEQMGEAHSFLQKQG